MDESGPITVEDKLKAIHTLQLTKENRPVILFAGRLAEQKRVEDLLNAADILQHLYPQMRVLIAGDGPLKSKLMQFSKDVALNDRVLFLGHFQDMNTLYAAADIVVLPSSYEGLPNVVMEAQLRAIPVVAAAAPGTIELVKHRETGLTHPVGDSTELARLVQELLNQPDLAQKLGAAGQQLVKNEFKVEKMADEFEKLYLRH
jgi:glycosyltransferase involved in cell wall biosynthesis